MNTATVTMTKIAVACRITTTRRTRSSSSTSAAKARIGLLRRRGEALAAIEDERHRLLDPEPLRLLAHEARDRVDERLLVRVGDLLEVALQLVQRVLVGDLPRPAHVGLGELPRLGHGGL